MHPPEFTRESAVENSYAAITMWHVLEHLYEPLEDLHRFNALLSSRAYLIIAVPNHISADATYYQSHWAAYDVPRHLWHFNPQTMEQMTSEAGFELLETHHMPMDPFYVSIMSNRYKTGGGLINGAIQGAKSFVQSSFNARKGSSVIYVLRKMD
ncbi:MAG: methyltransferase domain-containing protein [Bacteroidota bacterium]